MTYGQLCYNSQNSKYSYYIIPHSDPICPFDIFFIINKHKYMQIIFKKEA